ncbi:hypothetical protein [Carboxylicivirga sp. RSCT41]|uniref:hypothetical protein n=1 Tax=Carboxylicivirga agarovorans TaxID=3417570 RepID=UPI003D331AEA
MKRVIITMGLLIYIAISLSGQNKGKVDVKPYLKQNWKTLGLLYLAGFGEGHAELLQHHYYKFEGKYPNANHQFWDPDLSWTNKYKNNDPEQGARFWGSTNVFVATTDAYHGFKFIQKAAIVGAVTINLNSKKKFRQYVLDAIIYLAAYTSGFYTSYGLMYN